MTYIVDPRATVDAGSALLPPKMTTDASKRILMAIGFQESGWLTTVQYGGGPAHGVLQFERGSGCRGVLTHPASKALAEGLCASAGIPATAADVWTRLADVQHQDFAVAFGRLLLWTDAAALPPAILESEQAAWDYYKRNWRPGKPDRKRWTRSWSQALAVPLV